MNQREPASRFSRRRLLSSGATALVLLAGLSSISARARATPPNLSELLSAFRKCPGLSADFQEDKRIQLLAAPLKSSGRIYFHPPHRIARVTEKPHKSHLVVSGKKIVVKEDGARREVDLSDKPALRELIGSLLHLLAGDEQKLLSDYEVSFRQQDGALWHLQLIPKNPIVKKLVESFSFSGQGIVLHELRVKEKNGDESITRFSSVDTRRKFSPVEIAQIFEI
jgi:outer membrane lipoprotein-sorting protein